jgi:sugar/nucleoside kinase (ribokinase family)
MMARFRACAQLAMSGKDRAVNRSDLRNAADREGIRRDSYSLDGSLPAERYVLSIEHDGWSVYYSERGDRSSELRFDTEDEACSELFDRLVCDPTTRG